MIHIGRVPDPLPEAEQGHVVLVKEMPVCDGCHEKMGCWDVKTTQGPWGNFCTTCAPAYAASNTTGTGKGQLWIIRT